MATVKAEEIFELKDLDKKWKWITKDRNGEINIFVRKPKVIDEYYYNNGFSDETLNITHLFNDLELDFGTLPIKKRLKIKE